MRLPGLTKNAFIESMHKFDRELRGNKDWAGWEQKRNFDYAIDYEGALYPPKEIISLATGVPTSNFNGGSQSNKYLEKYGFTIRRLRNETSPDAAMNTDTGLRAALTAILTGFPTARKSAYQNLLRTPAAASVVGHGREAAHSSLLAAGVPRYGFVRRSKSGAVRNDDPVLAHFRGAQAWLQNCAPVKTRPGILVAYSAGKGNWAAVPWISLLDKAETSTTQSGRYVVFPKASFLIL